MGSLAAVLVFFAVVRCVIFPVEVKTPMQGYSYRTLNGMAMYTPEDAPLSGPPGNGRSYIEFKDFKVDRTDMRQEFQAASIQLLVLPDYDVNSIGIDRLGQNFFCCTPTIKLTGEYEECKEDSQLNKLISTLSSYDENNYVLVEFEKGQKHQSLTDWKFNVKGSQIHIIAVAVCDARIGEVTLTGTTEWMNPYGHLPAQLYGFLPFYGWMCVIYLFASCVWFVLNAIYWKDILHVQNCITGVLAMCVIEMLTWYFDYLNLNNNGVRLNALFLFGMMTSVSRRTISRMLVVAVSMGYGVVKPILGEEKKRIIILGCVYWSFAFAFEVLIHYSQTQEVSPMLRTSLTLPVALLDGYFWCWIFTSLKDTVSTLKKKRQVAKLGIYKKFSWCLGVSLAIALVFACFQFYYVWMKLYIEHWKIMWIQEIGFWQVLFTFLFFSIMTLWRPSRHASKYAYAQQIATEENEDADMFEDTLGKPDTAEAVDDDQFEIGDENEDCEK